MAGALAWTLQLVFFVLIAQQIIALIEAHAFRYRAVSERVAMTTRRCAGNPISTTCRNRFSRKGGGRGLSRRRRRCARHRARRAGRAPRQDRLRQVDHLQHDRRARRTERRAGAGEGSRSVSPVRLVPRPDRDRVPERPAAAVAHRHRQCRARSRHARHAAAGAPQDAAQFGSPGSASPATSAIIRMRCPAACASASRSRALSRPTRRHPAVRRAVLRTR